jgi:hypothetical protein
VLGSAERVVRVDVQIVVVVGGGGVYGVGFAFFLVVVSNLSYFEVLFLFCSLLFP